MIKIADDQILSVCSECSTMAEAAHRLGIHFGTLKKHANRLGCYNPNQGAKGTHKKSLGPKIPLDEILNGEHPTYQTFKLKARLISSGIKCWVCEGCGLNEWNEQWVPLELHHINGMRTDHRLENLRMLCPNCHSQTDTYRAKNAK